MGLITPASTLFGKEDTYPLHASCIRGGGGGGGGGVERRDVLLLPLYESQQFIFLDQALTGAADSDNGLHADFAKGYKYPQACQRVYSTIHELSSADEG